MTEEKEVNYPPLKWEITIFGDGLHWHLLVLKDGEFFDCKEGWFGDLHRHIDALHDILGLDVGAVKEPALVEGRVRALMKRADISQN